MECPSPFLAAIGGQTGCDRLSAEFYGRVARDPVLRPLFPGKSLRCAIEEFSAFLVQFLGGDEKGAEKRWWLGLRESHARFRIGAGQRAAWLRNMSEALSAIPLSQQERLALMDLFTGASSYVMGGPPGTPAHENLEARWAEQLRLEETVAAIAGGDESFALAHAPRFRPRPSVFVGLLSRMMQSRLPGLIRFAEATASADPSLGARRSGGRPFLHLAAAAGCPGVVNALLAGGVDPDLLDRGCHTPLWVTANECGGSEGPEIVRALIGAGADPNARGGVTRSTPLHMAARRGFAGIAAALLDHGAAIHLLDSKGASPLQRARNCRQAAVVELLTGRLSQR